MTGTDPTTTVAIRNLSLSFGDHQVLEDVSLAVEPGELVGLVGPNGAGKTTLLRATSGALEPDAGRVEADGVDVLTADSKTASRLIAVVPQDTALSFSFPVRDVVAMGRYPHRSRFSPPTDEDRRAVERALERTRTVDLADRSIDELSGGQRQRVIVARAIAQETPALLLDEPTASLDVNHQLETLELVREVVDGGTAAMAAIHDLSLAARYCDRLALLDGGTIRQVGPPAEVLTADAVGDAFDASAVVTTDPVSGATSVTALPDRVTARKPADPASEGAPSPGQSDLSTASRAPRVHVLGAGPIASSTLARLALAGVRLSIGPLPAGDVAAETAGQFDLETFETDPFSVPAESVITDVSDAVDGADAVVVADPILGDDDVFDRLVETVCDADAVIGVVRRPAGRPGAESADSRRRVLEAGAVAPRYENALARSLDWGRIVDLESVVEAVVREVAADDHGESTTDCLEPSGEVVPGATEGADGSHSTGSRGDGTGSRSDGSQSPAAAETDGGDRSRTERDDGAESSQYGR